MKSAPTDGATDLSIKYPSLGTFGIIRENHALRRRIHRLIVRPRVNPRAAAVTISVLLLIVAFLLTPEHTHLRQVQAQNEGICGRNPVIQMMILGALPVVDSCEDVTDADLASISSLNNFVGGTRRPIYRLEVGDLAGLSGLTTLFFVNSELSELPSGVFDDLVSLQVVVITSGRLTRLPADLFASNPALERVDFLGNRLETLPQGFLDNNPQLLNLGLSWNRLTSLPHGLLDAMPNLTTLSVNSNRLTSLPVGIFDSSPLITYLYLQRNELTLLPHDIFDPLTQLQHLFLDSNRLATIPANLLANPAQTLINFRIGGNEAETVPDAFFTALATNLPNLQSLDLTGFQLTAAQFDALASAIGGSLVFHQLDMAETGLTVDQLILMFEAFAAADADLSRINLSRNDFGPWFDTATSADIQRLENALSTGLKTRLFSFFLADSTLTVTTLRPFLENIRPGINNLDLTGVDLSGIAAEIAILSRFTNLGRLTLDNTGITTEDLDAIVKNVNTSGVFTFYIRNNGLEALPDDGFTAIPELALLSLAGNHLKTLPAGFVDGVGPPGFPLILNLVYNDLTEIPTGAFTPDSNVIELYLIGNQLETIGPRSLDGLAELEKLYLNGNQIVEIAPSAFSKTQRLFHLELANNQLASLDETFYDDLKDSLNFLDISGNPFRESTTLARLKTRLRNLISGDLPALDSRTVEPTNEPTKLGRILRIEPAITNVVLSPGDQVKLSVNIYGRQNLLDDELANGRTITWDHGQNGTIAGSGAEVEHSASQASGSYTVTATVAAAACFGDENQCSATFNVTVRRSSASVGTTVAPVNPTGVIPETLSDDDGVAYAVFTPVEGGSFAGDGYSLVVGAGAVANGEYIGVSMAPAGDASNVGMTWHRYTLAGSRYAISAVDADGEAVSDYRLNDAVTACVPLPPEFRGNISDIVLAATDDSGGMSVLSTSVKITSDGASVCGKLSTLPATVAVGKVGSPPEVVDPAEEIEDDGPLPDTGGFAPVTPWLFYLMLTGMFVTAAGLTAMRRVRPFGLRFGRE